MSYAGILKLRANTPFEMRPEEWHKEVPEGVIGMAKTLLRSMSFPEDYEHVVFGEVRAGVLLSTMFALRQLWPRLRVVRAGECNPFVIVVYLAHDDGAL